MNDLEAVRAGRWKLHVAKHGTPVTELYDLDADPAETDRPRRATIPRSSPSSQAHAERGPRPRSATPGCGRVGDGRPPDRAGRRPGDR